MTDDAAPVVIPIDDNPVAITGQQHPTSPDAAPPLSSSSPDAISSSTNTTTHTVTLTGDSLTLVTPPAVAQYRPHHFTSNPYYRTPNSPYSSSSTSSPMPRLTENTIEDFLLLMQARKSKLATRAKDQQLVEKQVGLRENRICKGKTIALILIIIVAMVFILFSEYNHSFFLF